MSGGFAKGATEYVENIVYRVMRPDEYPSALNYGIMAKNPLANVDPQYHITHGHLVETNWISTTRDLRWARRFQEETPIYMIDLSKVRTTIVDTTNPGIMDKWYYRARVLATRASEVLIDRYIPHDAIRGIIPK